MDLMPTPVTDAEKLISSVLEAERPTIRFFFYFPVSFLCLYIFSIKLTVLFPSFFFFSFSFNSILHEKSLIEANKIFLEKHKGDCQTCSV